MAEPAGHAINEEVLRSRIASHFGHCVRSNDIGKVKISAVGLLVYSPSFTGSHHLTFLVTMEDGSKLFARAHNPFFRHSGAGVTSPSKMPSEIATIKFVREHTNIPVPAVFVHDADADGAVGGEWMVQEYIEGTPLIDMWSRMTIDQHQAVARAIADVWVQLISLRFPKIGSIYEDDAGGFIVDPMTFMPSNVKIDLEPPEPTKCGPFESAKAWLLALAARELDCTKSVERTPLQYERIDTVLHNIRDGTILDSELSQKFSQIALEHVDIGASNIIVESENPTVITGIIDWEGARTVPFWAMEPRFYSHCPNVDEADEGALQAITREAVRQTLPDWCDATAAPGREFRLLYARARCSDWDPEHFYLYELPATV